MSALQPSWGNIRNFAARGGFVNANQLPFAGRIWFVDTINGSNSASGRGPGVSAFKTMAHAFTQIDSFDIISVAGVVKEQVVAPLGVFDVTIVGAANRPRQATSGGVPTGGGSTWVAPSSPAATTALLELIEQGWTIQNMFFAPVASSPCIKLTRAEDAVHPDPSHASILGCKFGCTGISGAIGIEDSGGCYHVLVAGNEFESVGGTAILGVAGAGIADCLEWMILDNKFDTCANVIDLSASRHLIARNKFIHTTTIRIKEEGSAAYNIVVDNQFDCAAAGVAHAGGFYGVSTDTWRNYVTDQAAFAVTSPTS